MATHYPKSGRGRRWTVNELKAIPPEWAGDLINDGDGLTGDVRCVTGDVSVRFRLQYRMEGKRYWFICGTWPFTSMEEIRRNRDDAKVQIKQGVHPGVAKEVTKIEAREAAEKKIKEHKERLAADLDNNALINEWLAHGVRRKDGNHELKLSLDKNVRPFIGEVPVRLTTDAMLRDLLGRIVERKANRLAVVVRNDLATMYHWAEKRQPWRKLLADGNPIDLVEINRIVAPEYDIDYARDRVLSGDELVELHGIFTAMDKESGLMTRLGLYHAVWQKPLLQLAQLLGLSDRGLAKICDKYDIPTPGRNHWALGRRGVLMRPTALPDPTFNPWIDMVKSKRGLSKKYQCAVWLCLATTCRVGELLLAEWDHVDFEAAEWFIPAANVKQTKGGANDHVVYLSRFALEQFDVLRQMAGDSRWVFPSPGKVDAPINSQAVTHAVGDRQLMFKDLGKTPNKRPMDNTLVLSNGERGEWTPHDMRRTSATMMQALGVPLDTIDRCQNHVLKGSKVRRHYLLHEYADEKREAWAALGEQLDGMLGNHAVIDAGGDPDGPPAA